MYRVYTVVFMVMVIFFITCVKENEHVSWNNPLDPNGSDYFPPVVKLTKDTSINAYDTLQLVSQATVTHTPVFAYIWYRLALSGDTLQVTDSLITNLTVKKFSYTKRDTGLHYTGIRVIDNLRLPSQMKVCTVRVSVKRPPKPVAMNDTVFPVKDTAKLTVKTDDTLTKYLKKWYWYDNDTLVAITDSVFTKGVFNANDTGKAHIIKVHGVYVWGIDTVQGPPDTAIVTVKLYAPVVKMVTKDTAIAIMDTFKIAATGSDTTRNILKYYWYIRKLNFRDSTDSGEIKKAFGKNDTGVQTVTVWARDDDNIIGAVDSVRITVKLYPPAVKAMKDTSILLRDTVKIYAFGSDSNGSIRKYYWAFDNAAFKDSTDSNFIHKSFKDTGIHGVKVKVYDDDGISSQTDSLKVTVGYKKPVVIPMNDTSVAINDSFTVHTSADDTDGTIEKYYWALDGVAFKDSTEIGQIKTIFKTAGTKPIKIRVRDNDDFFSETGSFNVNVHLYPPSVIPMNDTTVKINASFYLHADGYDTNGAIIGYVWALDGRNFRDTTKTGRILTIRKSDGPDTVLVRAMDDDSIFSQTKKIILTITFKRPVIYSITNSPAYVNQLCTLRVTAGDTDGIVEKYFWNMDALGSTSYRDSSTESFFIYPYTSAGLKRMEVRVRDNDGKYSEESFIYITVTIKPGLQSVEYYQDIVPMKRKHPDINGRKQQ